MQRRGHRPGGQTTRELMQQLFDFERIRALLARPGFRMRFDAMHAVTGPYAHAILEGQLGAPAGSVINGVPLPDFGGGHPDPNPTYADELIARMFGADAPDFGAASDGDGDRNMIVGRHFIVTPSDSLAVLAANATLVPGYAAGLKGVARSMPTSARGRPRGRRRWASPATKRRPAGSSSATCSTPACARCAARKAPAPARTTCARRTACGPCCSGSTSWRCAASSVEQIVREHWQRFGRNVYSRHDYEGVDAAVAKQIVDDLRDALPTLPGRVVGRPDGRAAPTTSATPTRWTARSAAARACACSSTTARASSSPVGHRHRRRDAAPLPGALRARCRAARHRDAGGAAAADRCGRGLDRAPGAQRAGAADGHHLRRLRIWTGQPRSRWRAVSSITVMRLVPDPTRCQNLSVTLPPLAPHRHLLAGEAHHDHEHRLRHQHPADRRRHLSHQHARAAAGRAGLQLQPVPAGRRRAAAVPHRPAPALPAGARRGGSVLPVERLRYVGLSHFEADECGSLNQWLALAPQAQPLCSQVAAMVSVGDLADRAPRALADGERLRLGRHEIQWFDTPHVPHGWECGLLMDTTHADLLLRRPVHPGRPRRRGAHAGRHPRPERGVPPADGLLRARAAHRRAAAQAGRAAAEDAGLHARQRLAGRRRRAAAATGRGVEAPGTH